MARQTPRVERPHSLYEAINRSLSSSARPKPVPVVPMGSPVPLPAIIAPDDGTQSADLQRCHQNLKLAQKEAEASQRLGAEAMALQQDARRLASAVDAICERERISILSLLADVMASLDNVKSDYARRRQVRYCRKSPEPGYDELFQVSSGHVYIGRARDMLPDGYGLYIFPTGAYYEGQWSDGVRSGFGRSMSRNSWGYKGEFRDDLMSGRGAIDCFVDDFSGVGQCCLYEGEFLNGMRHGLGALTLADGTMILARHESDRMLMANVVISYPDGSRYEGAGDGQYISGGGILRFSDGSAYADCWQGGFPSGHGVAIRSDGTLVPRSLIPDGVERPGIHLAADL